MAKSPKKTKSLKRQEKEALDDAEIVDLPQVSDDDDLMEGEEVKEVKVKVGKKKGTGKKNPKPGKKNEAKEKLAKLKESVEAVRFSAAGLRTLR